MIALIDEVRALYFELLKKSDLPLHFAIVHDSGFHQKVDLFELNKPPAHPFPPAKYLQNLSL